MFITSVTHSAIVSCATFLFLPHFDVICDLLLNRRPLLKHIVYRQLIYRISKLWLTSSKDGDGPIVTAGKNVCTLQFVDLWSRKNIYTLVHVIYTCLLST